MTRSLIRRNCTAQYTHEMIIVTKTEQRLPHFTHYKQFSHSGVIYLHIGASRTPAKEGSSVRIILELLSNPTQVTFSIYTKCYVDHEEGRYHDKNQQQYICGR